VKDRLEGKRILIVDDEPDILASLCDLLSMSHLVQASSFEEGRERLEKEEFDIAILDIMGVEGYKLLEFCKAKKVIAVMLTAHAFSVKDTVKSFKGGASYFVPKEQMANIVLFLNEILETREKGGNVLARWFDRFASYYDKRFGVNWRNQDKDFWEKFKYWI
jgi:DNA-binding response OmpR family regulator